MRPLLLMALMAALPLMAEAAPVNATRNLPAGTILSAADLSAPDEAAAQAEVFIGMQTRVTIYAGRPVSAVQLRNARLIARNQIVPLHFTQGALSIETSGRALAEGAAGDVIPVMNMGSRQTVNARVQSDGTLLILR